MSSGYVKVVRGPLAFLLSLVVSTIADLKTSQIANFTLEEAA